MEITKELLFDLYENKRWNVSDICKYLNISRKTFYKYKNNFQIKHREKKLKNNDFLDEIKTPLGAKIIELRKLGYNYDKIQKELNCSKSTIHYYCQKNGKNSRDNLVKVYSQKASLCSFCKKISRFKKRISLSKVEKNIKTSWFGLFRTKVSRFVLNYNRKHMDNKKSTYSYKDVLKHIGGWQTKCYLTGRPIDLTKDQYQFDHIIPIAKGGDCSLCNLGVTCPEANMSKTDLTLEEYLALCKEVLENFGYKVLKQ